MRRHNGIFVHLAGLAALLPMVMILALLGSGIVIGGMAGLFTGSAAAADAGVNAGAGRGGVLCSQQFAPVCAELRGQRVTYSNACFARAAGARVVHEGACGQQRPGDKGCVTGGRKADPAADPGCRSWTDGCNICRRARPGAPAACTKMACASKAPARCLLRFGEGL